MRKILKISIITAVLLCTGLMIGGYIFISSKITPEKLKAEMEKSLKGLLPGAEITVGNLSYSIGLSVTVRIEKLEGTLKGRPLFALKRMETFIPLWSLLTGGGTVDISLDNPFVHYTQTGIESNWSLALGENIGKKEKEEEKTTTDDKEESSSQGLKFAPPFIGNSKLNVKLKTLSLFYSKDNTKHNVVIDKLVFKDIGLNSFLSFEMDSLFRADLNKGQKMSLRLTAIGEVKIKNFVEKSVLPISTVITISDIKATDTPYDIKTIENTLNVFIDKEKNIHGTSKLKYQDSNTLSFKFHGNSHGDFTIEELESSLSVKDILESIKMDISGFDAKDSRISLAGGMLLKKAKLYPEVNVEVGPNLQYSLEGITTLSKLSAEIRRKTLSFAMETKALGGVISSQNIITYDFDSLNKGLESIKNVKKTVHIKDIKIKKHHMDSFVNPPKTETQTQKTTVSKTNGKNSESILFSLPFVNGESHVTIDNSFFGTSKIRGLLKIRSQKHSLVMEKSRLAVDKGTFSINGNLKRRAKSVNIHFLGDMKNVNADSFNILLPKYVGAVEGIFSGMLSGSVQYTKKSMNYSADVKLSAKDGRIEKMDISPYLKELMASLPANLNKKVQNKNFTVNPSFKEFFLDARFKNSEYAFKDIRLKGSKDKMNIRGDGRIYPLGNREGEMFFHYKDASGKLDNLLKDTGEKAVPLRLVGKGLVLGIDKSYTIKRLTQGYAKHKGKSKVKKAVEKNLKKVLKNKGGKKLKGLLDSLF